MFWDKQIINWSRPSGSDKIDDKWDGADVRRAQWNHAFARDFDRYDGAKCVPIPINFRFTKRKGYKMQLSFHCTDDIGLNLL